MATVQQADNLVVPETKVVRGKRGLTHDAIVDYIISNPGHTYKQIAAEFGFSPEGIGIIVRSDGFQARFHARKVEMVDPVVLQRVTERLDGLAHASIDILQRKLAVSEDANFALKVLETASRAGGYGASAPASLQASFVVHLPGPASSTAEWSNRFAAAAAPILHARLDDAPSEVQDVEIKESGRIGGEPGLQATQDQG